MKILLADPPQATGRDKYIHTASTREPVGLLFIAATLQQAGHKVLVQSPFNFKQFAQFSPHIVGLSVMTFQHPATQHIVKQIKQTNPQIKIIVGGPHPSGYPQIVLNPHIDIAVIGEGEKTILELVQVIKNKTNFLNTKGIAVQNNNSLTTTKSQKIIDNLDELPSPLRYKSIFKHTHMTPIDYNIDNQTSPQAVQINYSRGCLFKCTYCNASLMWQGKIRWRNPKKAVDEIIDIQNQFNITFFAFTDLTFNINPKQISLLCDELTRRRVKTNWSALCSPAFGDLGLYQKMARSGCVRISWGIETEVNLRKNIKDQTSSLQKIKQVLQVSHQAGIINRGFMMLGHPHENLQNIKETQHMLHTLPLDDLRFVFITPFPGTPLWQQYKNQLITHDFSRFTTEQPIIRSKYFTPAQQIEIRHKLVTNFFTSQTYQRHCQDKIKKFPHLRKPFESLWESLKAKHII